MKLKLLSLIAAALACSVAAAKLPAPSDEAKAKAAEAAAKTAWTNKVADFQLCKAQDRIAVRYVDGARKAGKEVKAATATPPCADPGAFVYPPPVASAPAAAASAAAAPPAAARAVKKI